MANYTQNQIKVNYTYTDDEIKTLIKKEVCKYYELQSDDIMTQIKRFARCDPDINSYLDTISKNMVKFIDDTFHNGKIELDELKKNMIIKANMVIEQSIKLRVDSILQKEPFDTISVQFIDSLKKKWNETYQKEFNSKINCLNDTINTLIFFNILFFLTILYLLFQS